MKCSGSIKMMKKIVITKKMKIVMRIDDLKNRIELWAIARDLHHAKNCKSQTLKTVEEVGELAWAINKNDIPATVDAIGDVTVTLMILCLQLDLDFEKCLESAWNEIKDREGITVDGNFIKNE
jgi:NTP pyrophosphatase (non-canonical NTP hydrolase)